MTPQQYCDAFVPLYLVPTEGVSSHGVPFHRISRHAVAIVGIQADGIRVGHWMDCRPTSSLRDAKHNSFNACLPDEWKEPSVILRNTLL